MEKLSILEVFICGDISDEENSILLSFMHTKKLRMISVSRNASPIISSMKSAY